MKYSLCSCQERWLKVNVEQWSYFWYMKTCTKKLLYWYTSNKITLSVLGLHVFMFSEQRREVTTPVWQQLHLQLTLTPFPNACCCAVMRSCGYVGFLPQHWSSLAACPCTSGQVVVTLLGPHSWGTRASLPLFLLGRIHTYSVILFLVSSCAWATWDLEKWLWWVKLKTHYAHILFLLTAGNRFSGMSVG